MELRPQGRAPLDPARQARGHAPLQPLQRVLLAVPRRVDDVLVRDLVARRDDAGGGAADQARARVHEARRCSRASACWTSAAAGARSRSTPRASTACTSPGSRCSEPQAQLARERAAAAGLADQVDIRVMDYREIAGETFDAIASIGMVEHVGSVNIDAYMASWPRCSSPAGGCSTTASRGCASATPRRARSRSATCSRTPRRCTSRASRPRSSAPACTPATSRTSRTTTRARCSSGRAASRPTSTGRGELGGDERVRVWRIYLRVSRQGFESGFIVRLPSAGVKPRHIASTLLTYSARVASGCP